MAFITDLEKHKSFNKEYIYNCYNCGKCISIKNNNSKWIDLTFEGTAILCMSCLFRLHLELNDMFEHTPNLGAQLTKMISKY